MTRSNGWKFLSLLVLMTVFLAGCGAGGISDSIPPSDGELTITGTDLGAESPLEITPETSADDVKGEYLPAQVAVTFDNGSTDNVDLVWSAPADYDETAFGETFAFTGSFETNGITDQVELDVFIRNVIEWDSDINEDTVWTSDAVYRVTSRVDVRALLQIEPGTRVEFEEGRRLKVRNEGQLQAGDRHAVGGTGHAGTDQDTIVFTSAVEVPGWWDGIEIRSPHPDNYLNNVVIEYGGGGNYSANLGLGGDARLELTNSVLRYSEAHGIHNTARSSEFTLESNVFENNEGSPVKLRHQNVHRMNPSNVYAGNGDDYVKVYRTTVSHRNLEGVDETWQAIDVPYRFEHSVRVTDGSELTIEAGAIFEFYPERRFTVRDSSRVQMLGEMRGEGTTDGHIVFRPAFNDDNWAGILIRTSRDNKMHNVVIDGAGDSVAGGSGNERANLNIGESTNAGHLDAANVQLINGLGLGLFHRNGEVNGSSDVTEYANAFHFDNNKEGDYETH